MIEIKKSTAQSLIELVSEADKVFILSGGAYVDKTKEFRVLLVNEILANDHPWVSAYVEKKLRDFPIYEIAKRVDSIRNQYRENCKREVLFCPKCGDKTIDFKTRKCKCGITSSNKAGWLSKLGVVSSLPEGWVIPEEDKGMSDLT